MNQFKQALTNSFRYLFAEFFVQILAFFVFCVAGLAWLYFSTIYAAIAVLILGIGLGTYLYGVIRKKGRGERE
jgi:Flp pilus assembly protein TadB